MMPRLAGTGALLAAFLASGASAAGRPPANLADRFGEFAACALIVQQDRHTETRIEYGAGQCATPLSPCSTFKIPNALIGLQTGAVSGPGHVKAWDGTARERAVMNRDHDLASAMRHSVVWYFQSLARDVGPGAMADWLERLDYGNRDISAGVDRCWLGSSLEIDAHGQLALLRALWRDGLPFDARFQAQVREMLAQDSELPGQLFGKTGSCRGDPASGRPDHGWFIGWIDWRANRERNPATTWFVVNIRGADARGRAARRIALELLAEFQP